MRFPNHILIDITKQNISKSEQYWIFKYFFLFTKSNNFIWNLSLHKLLFLNAEKFLNKFHQNQIKFTIKYNNFKKITLLNNVEKNTYLKLNSPKIKVKNKLPNQNVFNLNSIENVYDVLKITKIYNSLKNNESSILKSNLLWTLFNINFLRKEKMYTKLKYSRVPQYDIVSGGAAALLAGFLGFLITEKFGFELVDSGDFYFLFMYLVFLFFSLRLFLKIMSVKDFNWNFLSLKWILNFYKILILFLINNIKFIFKLK